MRSLGQCNQFSLVLAIESHEFFPNFSYFLFKSRLDRSFKFSMAATFMFKVYGLIQNRAQSNLFKCHLTTKSQSFLFVSYFRICSTVKEASQLLELCEENRSHIFCMERNLGGSSIQWLFRHMHSLSFAFICMFFLNICTFSFNCFCEFYFHRKTYASKWQLLSLLTLSVLIFRIFQIFKWADEEKTDHTIW